MMNDKLKAIKEQGRHISSLRGGLGTTDAIQSLDELVGMVEEELNAEREAKEKAEARAKEPHEAFEIVKRLHIIAVSDVIAYKQRAEAAEKRNREAMEQEPFDWECLDAYFTLHGAYPKLYAAPIPPADVAELQRKLKATEQARDYYIQSAENFQRESAELTRKLAEIQALSSAARRKGTTGKQELTKLLEEARKQAVPEGWKLVPIEPTEEMLEYVFRKAIKDCETEECYERPFKRNIKLDYRAMLSAAPQPDAAIRAKGNRT